MKQLVILGTLLLAAFLSPVECQTKNITCVTHCEETYIRRFNNLNPTFTCAEGALCVESGSDTINDNCVVDSPLCNTGSSDFACTGGGIFPSVHNCSEFYVCTRPHSTSPYEATKYECASGEVYSPECEDCIPVPSSVPTCRSSCNIKSNNGKAFQVQGSDDQYYVCLDTAAYVFQCPPTMKVDASKLPDNIIPCSISCSSNSRERFAHETDVSRYYDCDPCSASTPFLTPCPAEKNCRRFWIFNADRGECLFPSRNALEVE